MEKQTLMLFRNGNTAFCVGQEQVPKVQRKSWLQLQFEWLEKCGYDPCGIDEILLPDGSHAKVFKLEDGGYNWEIVA